MGDVLIYNRVRVGPSLAVVMQGTVDVQIKEARRPPLRKCALAYIMLRTGVKKNFRHSRLYPLDIDIMEGLEDMTSRPGLPPPPTRRTRST